MAKILVFIYDGMADFETSLLTHLLGADCGKELLVVSNDVGIVKSKSGMLFVPHIELKKVITDEVDGIIIPGGWLANLDEKLIDIIRELHDENKLIAAICAAPWILAKAGVLYNRKYTTSIVEWQDKHLEFFGIDDPFPRECYVEGRVIRDGNIITAKGMAFIDFTIEVCDYFGLFKDETEKKEFENDIKGY
ncbi:MAG: thiamine biosynthesis protein ThiJ [Firmicutes bacterium HGW-Firmicutes-1]|jgi:putative intracellular protease/amidase|nr:MAG: thiamine biosynthesis protein ThiJ [Firmicutes bacterium HGW-Firmicutes-1]